jgi:transposase
MKKSEIVNHFQKKGYPQRTIYNTINRLHNGEPIKDKKQTGRPTSWTSTRNNQLKRLINNRKGVSQRRLSRKFGVSQMTICRQLSKMSISCFKREKTPKYTENQAEKAKNLCKKLANLFYRSLCCVVLDDEKYFTHVGSNMQGNDIFYTNDKSKCPDNVRFAGKE